MQTEFEVGKWYKRGNGDLIRVVCVDAPGDSPVIGVCERGGPWTFTRSGQQTTMGLNSSHDLIPTPIEPKKKGVVWVNVYKDETALAFTSSLDAENSDFWLKAGVARIRVEWEEGRFDND